MVVQVRGGFGISMDDTVHHSILMIVKEFDAFIILPSSHITKTRVMTKKSDVGVSLCTSMRHFIAI